MIFDHKSLDAATEAPSRNAFYRQSTLIGLGIFVILAVFQPFGTYVFEHRMKYLFLAGYGLLVPLTGFVLRSLLAFFQAGFFAPDRWTFRRELVMNGLFLLLSVVFSYFYHHLAIGSRLSAAGFLVFVLFAAATAALPMCMLLIWRFFEIKNQLAMQEFSEKAIRIPAQAASIVTLQGENKNEKLTLHRHDLLYLRAADNYVVIFLQKNGQLQRHMLRGALGHFFQQLENTGTFRQVHRSYVVNFDHPIRLGGKYPNYFLAFENAPEAGEIPVSRLFVAETRALLADRPR